MSSLIEKMLASALEDGKADDYPPLDGQDAILADFVGKDVPHAETLKVGDAVVRTHHGQPRFRFPNEWQVARVVSVFDTPALDKDGQAVHGEIAVVCGDGNLRCFAVDFRFYKLAA